MEIQIPTLKRTFSVSHGVPEVSCRTKWIMDYHDYVVLVSGSSTSVMLMAHKLPHDFLKVSSRRRDYRLKNLQKVQRWAFGLKVQMKDYDLFSSL